MIEQFNFDIRLIFAILMVRFPQQSTGSYIAISVRTVWKSARNNGRFSFFYGKKDGVTQQELCNATFKDKPSMTRLIDNMERQHLVVRISDKKDRRTNLIHLTKDGKELEEKARIIAGQTLKEALHGITLEELSIGQEVLKKVFYNTKD